MPAVSTELSALAQRLVAGDKRALARVTKTDHPLTDTMVRDIRTTLSLAPQAGWRVPIVKTEAVRGAGIDALAETLERHRAYVAGEGTLTERRRRNLRNEVVGMAIARMRVALEAIVDADAEVAELLDAVVARRLDPASAARALLTQGDEQRPLAGRPGVPAEVTGE